MKRNFDFRKEWEKTKVQLDRLGKKAVVLAKKGEDELIKISKQGKLHLDATALGLRIEKLYYTIGKEYVLTRSSAKPSAKLDSMIVEITDLEKELGALKTKIRRSASAAKSVGQRSS